MNASRQVPHPDGQRARDGLLDEMDDVAIVITPTGWLSWDLTRFMHALVARDIDPAVAEDWFLSDD